MEALRRRGRSGRDPRLMVRIVLGTLLAAILVTAAFVFRPWEGSVADMQRNLSSLRADLERKKGEVARLRALVETIGKAREGGEGFLGEYFLDRRTAYSTLLSELNRAAAEAGIDPREHDFAWDLIEGSESLSMLTVNANYEGAYNNLVRFLRVIDRSPKLFILDSLQAAPQQSDNRLRVRLRMHAFVEDFPSGPPAAGVTAGASAAQDAGGAS